MIKRIYKFPLEYTKCQTVDLPPVHRILCVQLQNGYPYLWAEVEPAEPEIYQPRTIWMVGTGYVIPNTRGALDYIGTVQDDVFVWHFYIEQLETID